MAHYKAIDTSPRFLAVNLEKQLLPGSFEHAVHYLLEHEFDLSLFDSLCCYGREARLARNVMERAFRILETMHGDVRTDSKILGRFAEKLLCSAAFLWPTTAYHDVFFKIAIDFLKSQSPDQQPA